jgi:dihydroorotase
MNANDSSRACALRITAGRLVCPASGIDAPGSVATRGDRVVAIGPDLDLTAERELHFPDAILLPGLIDLHAHPAKSGSQWGIDPDIHLLARGTTTALSQGDAGADGIEDYVLKTIQASRTRVKLAINLSRRGETGPGGCFRDLDWVDVAACVAAIERHREHVWGIAVNASHHCCVENDPKEVVRRGIEAAEQAGVPLLYGLRRPEDWPLAEQLSLLRPGDVVTYCYRRMPHCIVADGRVLPEVKAARERGVLFDVGHGTNSFDFEVAKAALADGFPPDTISTDWQRAHVGQSPRHDLPLVMSKLRATGMPERDIFRAVTATPAKILGVEDEIGSLRPGMCADLTVLSWIESPIFNRWEATSVIRGGRLVGNKDHDGIFREKTT